MTSITLLHYQDFYLQVEQEGVSSLVLFSSSQCGSCRAWKQHIQKQTLPVLLFEVDVTSAQGLVEDFNIHSLPAFALYKHGDFHRFFSPDMRLSLHEQVNDALLLPQQEDPTC